MNTTTQQNKFKPTVNWPAPQVWRRPRNDNGYFANNKRSSPRHWRSQPIWWRPGLCGDVQQGWMVDTSTGGAAFLYRGNQAPLFGTRIETSEVDPRGSITQMNDALVRRVKRLHGDLFLVAAQYAEGIKNTHS